MKKCDLQHQQAGSNIKFAGKELVVDKGHVAMLDGFVNAIRNNIRRC